MSQDPIVIVSAIRTPVGAFQGVLGTVSAPDLGAAVLRGALNAANIDGTDITEAYMGCVLQAGLGQAPARQSVIKAGLPTSIPATTIHKVCGSGLKSIALAHDALMAGERGIMLAGGMESMSMAPYLLKKGRSGYRMGHDRIFDHMVLDGLEDAYSVGTAMGIFADALALTRGISRESMDDFAIESAEKAIAAQKSGAFDREIIAVSVQSGKDKIDVIMDEPPTKIRFDKIRSLHPAFQENGTVTAANSSSISDGAASVAIMRLSDAHKRAIAPRAIIRGHSSFAQEPQWFTLAPVGAIDKLLKQIGWNVCDVDLFEINEAFAVVTMAAIHDLKLPPEKVNVHGGACALGHPIGASGARILVTLLHALETRNLKKGIAALCIGGGEGIAMAIERP